MVVETAFIGIAAPWAATEKMLAAAGDCQVYVDALREQST